VLVLNASVFAVDVAERFHGRGLPKYDIMFFIGECDMCGVASLDVVGWSVSVRVLRSRRNALKAKRIEATHDNVE
jgi:hypothetical protein